MRYIWCRNKSYRSSDWKPCATGGISAAVIERCVAQEGTRLLEQDIRLAEALSISGSPTWLANNRHTFGGIAPESIKGRLCQHNPGLRGCARKLSGQAAGTAPGACGQ
jgi:hypothetical protein